MTSRGSEATPRPALPLQLEPPQRLDAPNFQLVRSVAFERRLHRIFI